MEHIGACHQGLQLPSYWKACASARSLAMSLWASCCSGKSGGGHSQPGQAGCSAADANRPPSAAAFAAACVAFPAAAAFAGACVAFPAAAVICAACVAYPAADAAVATESVDEPGMGLSWQHPAAVGTFGGQIRRHS